MNILMKRLLLFVSLLMLSAGVDVVARQKDDLCTWTTVSFSKSFGTDHRWNAGLLTEYRHRIHNGVSGTDQFFARPIVSYKLLPWLKLQYQVDFASSSRYGFFLDFIPEVTLSHKVGGFTFAFRQRVMTTCKVEEGTDVTVLRSRGKVDYRIPDTPLSIHFAVEPYWCEFSRDSFNMFQKVRWYAGFDVELTDDISIRPEYICLAYHNYAGRYARRTYDDHVIYMTFIVKL